MRYCFRFQTKVIRFNLDHSLPNSKGTNLPQLFKGWITLLSMQRINRYQVDKG